MIRPMLLDLDDSCVERMAAFMYSLLLEDGAGLPYDAPLPV